MTETKDQNSEFKEQLTESDLRMLFHEMPLKTYFKDIHGRYQLSSRIYNRLYDGNDDSVIIGKTDADILEDRELGERFLAEDLEIVKTGREKRYLQKIAANGKNCYYEIHKKPVRNEQGDVIGILGMIVNMTNLILTQMELEEISQTDSLTNAYNRSYLDRRIAEIKPEEYPLAVVMIDFNHMKIINDTLGHNQGDLAIRTLVDNMRKYADPGSEIIRIGGDEFLILCPASNEEKCQNMIARIREGENSLTIGDGMPLTASYGYNFLNEGDVFDEILKEADAMMYREKRKGRSRD